MQLSIDFDGARAKRVRVARKLGAAAGQRAAERAEADGAGFGQRAYDFIVAHVRSHGPVAGEDVTLAAKLAGIRPADDRAFGPAFSRAIRAGAIRVVGSCARVRGHGTAGGRVYAAGAGA